MKKKLKIAQVAPLYFSVPPKRYGGIEKIISFLAEGLTKKGHKVTLFASGDSKTKAKLVALTKKGIIYLGATWKEFWWNIFNHSFVFERAEEFDIIHCHWNMMGAFFQRFVRTPVVHTLHNIPSSSSLRWQIIKHYKDDLRAVFISKSEKRNSPVRFKNNWVIYNGIDISEFKFNQKPKEHFIWIARVCPAKGTKEAIEIAKKAKIKLLLAGQIQPQHREYFEKEIKPRLTSKIRYVGELPKRKLPEFYGSATGCLYPIRWEEPFGLIMAESMACGTPVVAFKRGSVPELIKNGKTGFVVKNSKEAVDAIKKIDKIDRKECRKWIEENFTKEKMVDDYEKLYYEILKKNK